MTATDIIERIHITDVAQALGVRIDRTRRRGVASWREGRNFSVSLDDVKNVWHDFVTGDGGGMLDLVQRVHGCNRADALRWVADLAGVALDDRPAAREDRRTFAERRKVATAVAQEIESWRNALIPIMNARKLAAVRLGDDEALARSASLCNVLENGPPADLVREFIRHRASDPADVARLIAVAREHDLETERIAAAVVLVLAAAEGSLDAN
jgi:hypothetical protein